MAGNCASGGKEKKALFLSSPQTRRESGPPPGFFPLFLTIACCAHPCSSLATASIINATQGWRNSEFPMFSGEEGARLRSSGVHTHPLPLSSSLNAAHCPRVALPLPAINLTPAAAHNLSAGHSPREQGPLRHSSLSTSHCAPLPCCPSLRLRSSPSPSPTTAASRSSGGAPLLFSCARCRPQRSVETVAFLSLCHPLRFPVPRGTYRACSAASAHRCGLPCDADRKDAGAIAQREKKKERMGG